MFTILILFILVALWGPTIWAEIAMYVHYHHKMYGGH